jgi:N-acetylglucosamine-6-phosphate deacetylase
MLPARARAYRKDCRSAASQVNGFNGVNFSTVTTVAEARVALRGLLAAGCAAVLPTVRVSRLGKKEECLHPRLYRL